MDANGLLSVLALLLAGFTFFPDAKRIDLSLRISTIERCFIVAIILAISIIVLSPVIVKNFSDFLNEILEGVGQLFDINVLIPIPWMFGFESETAIFSLHMVIILYFWFKLPGCKVARSKIGVCGKTMVELLQEKKFSDLSYLLNRYHVQLFSLIQKQSWGGRLRGWIQVKNKIDLSWPQKIESKLVVGIKNIRNNIAYKVPLLSKRQLAIKRALELIFKSAQYTAHLTDANSLLAAKASLLSIDNIEAYRKLMFTYLISNTSSQLYVELKYNQNWSHTGRFDIDPSNTLLSFYLSDVSVACQVDLGCCIGKYVENFIKNQRGIDNFYNSNYDNYGQSDESDSCPIYAGIMLFEIMIPEGIYQNFNDHLELMYYEYFIKEILNSLERSPSADITSEFPTKFDYLIYKIFNASDHWVRAFEYLNDEQVRSSVIIKFAAENLGNILRRLLASDKITERQKRVFIEATVSTMIALENKNHSSLVSKIFDSSLNRYAGGTINKEALNAFKLHIKHIDSVVLLRASEIKKKLDLINA